MNIEKINELKQWLIQKEVSLAFISNPQSIAYFTGYRSDPHERILGLFISTERDPFLFAPALEVEAARKSPWPYDVVGYLDTENPWKIIATEIKERFGTLTACALEKAALSLDRYELFARFFENVRFTEDLSPLLQQMQLIKTKQEIDGLLEAGTWADVAFEIGFSALKAGATEQEIVAEIEYQLKRKGVSQMSFDTMVLTGPRAADPHGIPNQTVLSENELVLFDLGVVWQGYCSDATRTVAYKEPTAFQREIHQIVLTAQQTAQRAVKPGITAHELDRIARQVIEEAGYGPYFNHRLGHGIGTSVHEFPSIVEGNELILEEGMCFSIEPGIYLPQQVGVRIEDCVYVTKDGCLPFTQTSKELLIIE
ncbi:aminopeptidase P family protein [Enterococcus sp. LJL98]